MAWLAAYNVVPHGPGACLLENKGSPATDCAAGTHTCPPACLPAWAAAATAAAECNPGMSRLPPSAAPVLSRLRVLSCDATVLFASITMLAASAGQLEDLYVR